MPSGNHMIAASTPGRSNAQHKTHQLMMASHRKEKHDAPRHPYRVSGTCVPVWRHTICG